MMKALEKCTNGDIRLGGAMVRMASLLVVIMFSLPANAASDGGPVAPCTINEATPYPAFAEQPNAGSWVEGDVSRSWTPASCIEWATGQYTVLTALAGRFRFEGSVDDILVKFGAQSAWRGLRYWSVSDGSWSTLIKDATALENANRKLRRADFALPELKSEAPLYFLQSDNRSSDAVVYRMNIATIESDRLIVTVENVSPVSIFVFTLFKPGDLRSTYIFVKLGPTDWGYYNLSGARERFAIFGNHGASYLNRVSAIYRHLIGLPGDQGPKLRIACTVKEKC